METRCGFSRKTRGSASPDASLFDWNAELVSLRAGGLGGGIDRFGGKLLCLAPSFTSVAGGRGEYVALAITDAVPHGGEALAARAGKVATPRVGVAQALRGRPTLTVVGGIEVIRAADAGGPGPDERVQAGAACDQPATNVRTAGEIPVEAADLGGIAPVRAAFARGNHRHVPRVLVTEEDVDAAVRPKGEGVPTALARVRLERGVLAPGLAAVLGLRVAEAFDFVRASAVEPDKVEGAVAVGGAIHKAVIA